jgi:uncharacterized protein (TIGR02266 family)
MTQDTRKDRRVKIVSLNVRYKSATVDEFIENHAHDVSRGGIYIKTANPFPAGTLLKFEIRLASDQAVIAGVGRVVWKRDSTQTSGERPGGMGVKFIKIDAPSTAVIDKLVNTKSDAGRAFEEEPQTSGETPPPPPVLKGAPASRAPAAPPMRKATMIGLGLSSSPPAKPGSGSHSAAPAPPRPAPAAPAGPVFPKTNPEAEMPAKQEQTVMKQAAELLEEALREAGGSMEDVGTNPLFAGAATAKAEPEPPTPLPPVLASDGVDPFQEDTAKAMALLAEMAPAPAPGPARVAERKVTTSQPPHTRRSTPVSSAPRAASVRPGSSRPAPASEAPPPPKKGLSGLVVTLVVMAAAAAGVVVFRDTLFGRASDTSAVAPPPIPSPTTSVAASASIGESPAPSASAASTMMPTPTATATPTPTAIAAKTAAAAPPKPAAVTAAPVAPRPKPAPKADDNPY